MIYLMECALCKVQYVEKAETAFNIELSNHRKDVNNPKSVPFRFALQKTWAFIQSSYKIYINRKTK